MIDKKHLRETMLALTEAELAQALEKYEQFLAAAQLDRSEPIENDELSQAKTYANLAASFDDREHNAGNKLRVLQSLDFGPKSRIEPGAAVRLGNRYLVIGVSTGEFVCSGENCIGISAAAPIYAAIEGKEAGDDAEFNGRTLHIGQVL